MPKFDLGLPSYEDSLFSTEKERQEANLEKVTKINIDEITDFQNHPFHIGMDKDMANLIDSIDSNGLLIPVLVRPNKNGHGYEMIAGHRRKYACNELGIKEIDAIVRDVDDDQATILMVDSNIQRENILPTERGKAYALRLEAMKHQGKRLDLTTSSQVETKYNKKRADAELAELVGDSRAQIQRYIHLTKLIEPLQKMVDGLDENFKIAFLPAYELSFLTKDEQEMLNDAIINNVATPSLAQAQELKRKSQSDGLDEYFINQMLSDEKPNQKEKITIKGDEINKYFPKSYTPKQKHDTIVKLLEQWAKKKEHGAR